MKRIEIAVNQLKLGMFVSALDRPWLETPYLIQGILIKSVEDITELARYCNYVFVDIDKSDPKAITNYSARGANKNSSQIITATPFHGKETYSDRCTAEKELPAAQKAYDTTITLIEEIFECIEHNTQLDIFAAQIAVESLRESVLRNADALLLLSRLKRSKQALYDNALKVSVLLLAFGRHLGLPREELSELGLGGLLMDIGKLHLPPEILKKNTSLAAAEQEIMQKHVENGEAILAKTPNISEAVTKIVSQHHERENGDGYPRRLTANQLHNFARMAAIVDSYEDLTAARSGIKGLKPFQIIIELKNSARSGLNSTLVEQFSHCIGMFPVGSLVELNSREVAIILTHNRSQRFHPKVMVILDAKKQPYEKPFELDLKSTKPGPSGAPYEIVRDLPLGAFNIDVSQYYL
ncbi:MAG: DUF3391 domain-containing protein [Nitrosomonas sp.]|nr:DUF3391 domain-containing protein [Nitrosomonas sp.]MBK7363914.1 DUF3391 domain-containing protein [Nitrosomonas sp.]